MPAEGIIDYSRDHDDPSNSRETHMGSNRSALAGMGRLSVRALFGLSIGLLVGCQTAEKIEDAAVYALDKGLKTYCERLTEDEQTAVAERLEPRSVDCGE